MVESSGVPLSVTVGEIQILVDLVPPALLDSYRRHADLVDEFPELADQADEAGAGYCFVAVNDGREWPQLVVTQRYAPAVAGFTPGVLLLPERRQLFLGAGTRLLAYQARTGRWRRCWVDAAECGFWGWRQHGEVVMMSAELELAAWNAYGEKLWTTFVEPPWSYRVTGNQVVLDVMGDVRSFDLYHGP